MCQGQRTTMEMVESGKAWCQMPQGASRANIKGGFAGITGALSKHNLGHTGMGWRRNGWLRTDHVLRIARRNFTRLQAKGHLCPPGQPSSGGWWSVPGSTSKERN